MAQQLDPQPDGRGANHLQDLVLQCDDVEELLNEFAEFSAFKLSIHNDSSAAGILL